jgi:hypothetical protein
MQVCACVCFEGVLGQSYARKLKIYAINEVDLLCLKEDQEMGV